MSIELLNSLRFIAPGIIIVLFWSILGSLTGDWKIEIPQKLSDIGSYISAIVVAALYYLTPLRDWANRKHFNLISENIRRSLVEIGGGDIGSPLSKWSKLRRLFYRIIDSDASLTIKAKQAYFNGFIWTTIADIKVISLAFATYALLYGLIISSQGSLFGSVLFLFVATICWAIGYVVTQKHKAISDEQLKIIRQFHRHTVSQHFRS